MVPNVPQKIEKNVSHKVKRRALDATLSLVVDEDHELQDHINKTTSFEKNRRQRIYDQTGEVCIERMIRIQDRTLRQKKLNPVSDLNVTDAKSKNSLFKSPSKRKSVETFSTSIQRQSQKDLEMLRAVQAQQSNELLT